MGRTLLVAVTILGAVVTSAGMAADAASPAAVVRAGASATLTGRPAAAAALTGPVRYTAPVSPLRVVRAFDPPEHEYGPGHLGVDLATRHGTAVAAAGDGVVSFSGAVAGRGVVVVQHADGVSTEYEPVEPLVSRGTAVRGGQPIGYVHGAHGTCAPDACLHWGARRDGQYLDPMLLLQPLGPVRLLPWTDRGG